MKNEVNHEVLQYPSVELAYEFVKPSYDWMLDRLEAANNKIQHLLTFSASITAVLPLVSKAIFSEISFNSGWFYSTIFVFILLVITGIIAKRIGNITLVNIESLYEKYLHYSNWEFKRNMLFWAVKHLNANKKNVNTKNLLLDIMTILLLCEIIFAVIWIATEA